jgi:hypothetical protein
MSVSVTLGTTVETNGAATIVLTEPAGAQQGDMFVACITHRIGTNTWTLPSGWTLIRHDTVADGNGRVCNLLAYIERGAVALTAGERTFTASGAPQSNGRIVGLRSTRGKLVFDASAGESEVAQTTAVASAGLTTARANEFLLMVCGMDAFTTTASGQQAATSPTSGSWTEIAEVTGITSGTEQALATATKPAAGGTGNLSYTASATGRHAISTAAFWEDYAFRGDNGTFSLSGQAVGLPIPPPISINYNYVGGQTFTPAAANASTSLINVPSGAADAARRLLIGVVQSVAGGGISNNVSAVTVDGVAATKLIEVGTLNNVSWWYTGLIPSGTDVDIDIKSGSSVTVGPASFGKIHVYRIIGARTAAFDTLSDIGTSGTDDPTGVIDVTLYGGIFILAAGGFYATTAATHAQPSGFVEDAEAAEFNANSTRRMTNSVSSYWAGTAETNKSITVDVTNGTGSSTPAINMVAVALQAIGDDPVLDPANGVFALTGQTANLRYGRRLNSQQGTFALSGQIALLQRSRIMAAAQGAFGLTGQVATFTRTYVLTSDFGEFLLVGQGITFTITPRNPWYEENTTDDIWTEQAVEASSWSEQTTTVASWTEDPITSLSWTEQAAPSNTWTEE